MAAALRPAALLCLLCLLCTLAACGGEDVDTNLRIEDFAFAAPPPFEQGKAIDLRFVVKGFAREDGKVHVCEDLRLVDPEGRIVLDDKDVTVLEKELSDHFNLLTFSNHLTTNSGAPAGVYELTIIVRDVKNGKTLQPRRRVPGEGLTHRVGSEGDSEPVKQEVYMRRLVPILSLALLVLPALVLAAEGKEAPPRFTLKAKEVDIRDVLQMIGRQAGYSPHSRQEHPRQRRGGARGPSPSGGPARLLRGPRPRGDSLAQGTQALHRHPPGQGQGRAPGPRHDGAPRREGPSQAPVPCHREASRRHREAHGEAQSMGAETRRSSAVAASSR